MLSNLTPAVDKFKDDFVAMVADIGRSREIHLEDMEARLSAFRDDMQRQLAAVHDRALANLHAFGHLTRQLKEQQSQPVTLLNSLMFI